MNMTLEMVKEIEKEFDEKYPCPNHVVCDGYCPRLIKSFFHTSLIALLEEDVERLNGLKIPMRDKTDHLHNAYHFLKGKNEAIDQQIAHLESLIADLKE
jgi:hypothetical protein